MSLKKKKAPILFAVWQTGDRANGGVESLTQVIEHIHSLDPIIITQLETPVNSRWRAIATEVFVWPITYDMGSSWQTHFRSPIKLFKRIGSHILTNWLTWRLIQQTDIHIVHINDPSAFWHTILGAKFGRAKVVFNVRDTKPPEQAYGLKWGVISRLSDVILVLSQEMQATLSQRLPKWGKAENKLHYIHSIVDTDNIQILSDEERHECRLCYNINDKTFAVGYVATFNAKKGQLQFLREVAKKIHRRKHLIHLYFIGDFEPETNPYAAECLQYVTDNNLEDTITFCGYQADITTWYQLIDLVVLATRYEGMARGMIEAIAVGTPVLSFDVCSAREILEKNQAGVVIPQGDYNNLTKALIELSQSERQLEIFAFNGQKTAKQLFEKQKIIAEYEQLYVRLIANAKR